MKWINGETWEHKKERIERWNPYFAWYPIKIGIVDGHHVKIWLEWIERKGTVYSGWDGICTVWDYREKSK
jgi:hypothetical protein